MTNNTGKEKFYCIHIYIFTNRLSWYIHHHFYCPSCLSISYNWLNSFQGWLDIQYNPEQLSSQVVLFWICENILPSQVLMRVPLILSMTSVIHSTEWLLGLPAQETYSCLFLASHCPIRTTFTSPLMILILLFHKSHTLQPLLPATVGSQVEELLLGLLGRCHFGGSLPRGYLILWERHNSSPLS